jgi:hypothetical protein
MFSEFKPSTRLATVLSVILALIFGRADISDDMIAVMKINNRIVNVSFIFVSFSNFLLIEI